MGECSGERNQQCRSEEVLEELGSAWFERDEPGRMEEGLPQTILKTLDIVLEQKEGTEGVRGGVEHVQTCSVGTLLG